MQLNSTVNGFVWGPPMLFLLVGTGIYLTIRTNFFSVLRLGYVLKNTFFKMFSKEVRGEGEITPFQAVATALAATVGTGNVAGVATAIALGGPGAIFWMWVSAIFGMTTKFGEVVLAVKYREKTEDGRFVGGPMYYIQNGLKMKWLAVIFSRKTYPDKRCLRTQKTRPFSRVVQHIKERLALHPIELLPPMLLQSLS